MTPAARERARVRTPLLLASACAWAILLAGPGHSALLHGAHGAHPAHHAQPGPPAAPGDAPWAALALGWAIMLVAMMLPVLGAPVRHVQSRSLWSRRGRAVAAFLAGYGAVWMAAGAVLMAAALALRASPQPRLAAGLAATLVVAWQASPWKQGCFNRLHGHPALPAFGVRADLGAAAFGVAHGFWCVGSCWGLMLLPMLSASGHLAIMALVSLWVWAEQLERAAAAGWALRVPLKAGRIILAQARLRSLRARGASQGLLRNQR